jgi:hypothetical protein
MKPSACATVRRQAGRFRPAGVGILVVGVLLLYFGLQSVRGGGHPLAATLDFDLCGRLGPQPAADLPELQATPQARIPTLGATRSATCYWPIDVGTGGASSRYVWLVMMSHASLRAEGNGGGTAKFVDTFIEETRASGDEVVPAPGPWKTASTIRRRGGGELQLLAEDDGVALWFSSRGVEREALVAFAGAAARRLRESK